MVLCVRMWPGILAMSLIGVNKLEATNDLIINHMCNHVEGACT